MSRPTRCFTPSRSRSLTTTHTHARSYSHTFVQECVVLCVHFPVLFWKVFFCSDVKPTFPPRPNFVDPPVRNRVPGVDGHRDVAILRARAIEGGAILLFCWISQFPSVAGRKYGYHRKRPRDTVRRRFCQRKTVQRARKFHSTKYRTAKQRTSIRSFTSASSYHS